MCRIWNRPTPQANPGDRLLSVNYKLNSAAQVTLAQYTYDDVGRVKTKKLATETSTYHYNVRSWLTQITGTKFNQTLAYNTAVNGVIPTEALYNGNISAMKWRAGDETTERGYKFSYDGLDRLTSATYGEGTNIASNLNRYNETVTAYDKMGNIKTLQRQGKLDSGWGMMDNLTYTYTGSKLTKVSDAATPSITYAGAFHFVDRANADNEYTYDANGNLTKDLNKNITSITYNTLNLPSVITFADNNSITYVYDAAGSKLSVAYKSGSNVVKTEYAGNKVYKNGTLSMILTEEGYVTVSGTPMYYYYLKDHQGNNRVVINQGGTVQQVNHYYAFGGLFGEGVQSSNQPYKYNGKELDRLYGLDMYDYGARHYDATLGRWFTVDPLAEKYYSISSYVYCANNPILNIDPDGRDWYRNDETGSVKWMDGSNILVGYSLIGASYTLNIGDGASITYTQNEVTSMTFTGAEASSWVSQIANGINCYEASSQMLQNEGVETAGRGSEILVTGIAANGRAGDASVNAGRGFAVVNQALENGNPIMVGVDYKNGSPNADGRTDHFILVSSKTETLNNGAVTSITYNFFDPRTSHQNYGTSTNNQLTISSNKMMGSYNHGGSNYNYTVTTVRRNR